MLKYAAWVIAFFLPILTFATTGGIALLNDSPFTLTAVVQGADGTFLGQAQFTPGQQSNFTSNFGPSQIQTPNYYDVALTPYTVVWKCPNGGFYSICSQVSPGALVTANTCPGNHFCPSKKKGAKNGKNGPPGGSFSNQNDNDEEEY
jgi:hypothetical protein